MFNIFGCLLSSVC